MTTPCRDIELFADGELDPAAAGAFREHLPTCSKCQAELGQLIQLNLLAGEYHRRARSKVVALAPGRARLGWRPAWAVGGGLLSLAAAAAIAFAVFRSSVPDTLWRPDDSGRLIDGRSSYARAGGYHPRKEGMLGPGGGTTQPLPLSLLARLPSGRDGAFGLAAAYLVRGQPSLAQEALQALEPLGGSADAESERALAHLLRADADQNDIETALRLTDSALEKNPHHGPALWNKALAAKALGLDMLAAHTFDAVAALHEPGWSDEARLRADQLRASASGGRDHWYAALRAGEALIASGTIPPRDLLDAPILRLYFYDAVRSRTSAPEVLSLMPLAHDLDARSDGTALSDYVRTVARRDFSARAPLARRYLQLVTRPDPAEGGRLLSELLRSKEADLLVGALVKVHATPGDEVERAAFQQRAREIADPWFDALWLQREAKAMRASGELPGAREKLQQALAVCQHPGLEFRCLDVELDLTDVLLRSPELEEAYAHAIEGWRIARRVNDWGKQVQLIEELGQLARLRDDLPLARAYLEEAIERTHQDQDKSQEIFVRTQLASAELSGLRVDAAREQLDAAIATGPLTLVGALMLADIARLRPEAGDAAAMDAFRAQLPGMTPSARAAATHALGRFAIESQPGDGRRLLEDAIAQVKEIATPGDEASNARAYSYTSLILASGRAGDFASAWARFEEEAGAALPSRCAVAAAVDSERTLILARSASGALDGAYDATRTSPLGARADGLVPARLLAGLRECAGVQVLARAPLYGHAGLLPRDLAWSYVLTPGAHPPEAQAGDRGTHLVVEDVALSPRRHSLAAAGSWDPATGPGAAETILSGAAATPAAVLRGIEDASAIDLVAHGLVDPVSNEAYLVLAPDRDGDTLRASRIEQVALHRRPVVVLASCSAAHPGPQIAAPRSLPAAFLRAGARAVLAAASEIPEREGPAFFSAVRRRIDAGSAPSAALRDERQSWLGQGRGQTWLDSVLLFE